MGRGFTLPLAAESFARQTASKQVCVWIQFLRTYWYHLHTLLQAWRSEPEIYRLRDRLCLSEPFLALAI